MIFNSIYNLFFNRNNLSVKREMERDLKKINSFDTKIRALDDNALSDKTRYFKDLLKQKKTLDDIMHEVFAVFREASFRILNKRHFDVQIKGGIALHRGMVAEMGTGEGKTLSVALAAYLRSLEGKGMHVVTVNDYLAKRDAESIGKIFKFLKISVGYILSTSSHKERQEAYKCDITYATNNELGFDYLRDNMQFSLSEKVQRELYASCIDEVDSVLIDEARIPLIISNATDQNTGMWHVIDKIVSSLIAEDYQIDREIETISLSDAGIQKVEKLLKSYKLISEDTRMYDIQNVQVVHFVSQSLRAHKLMKRDVDYIVQDNKIFSIQKSTGRVAVGRRFSNNLHQAIEAKENVTINQENEEVASISLQNYFLHYRHLSGTTGTAITEKDEFKTIYGLDVVQIAPNKPLKRVDHNDLVYGTEKEKNNALLKLIQEKYQIGQPMLIGTDSVQSSEKYSHLLKENGIPHNLLNAKNHEQEAYIIAQAGCYKNVTIATNMAGRGTDIILGGNPEMLIKQKLHGHSNSDPTTITKIQQNILKSIQENREKVKKAGGLFVIGTVRHESRRIDNQLRGRAGRQGDVGASRFFLSLDDNLIKTFSTDKMRKFLKDLVLKDNESINHPTLNKIIERAQKKVEYQYYSIRKKLFEFDSVIDKQRNIVYSQRDVIMSSDDIRLGVFDIAQSCIEGLIERFIQKDSDIKNTVIVSNYLDHYNNLFFMNVDKDSFKNIKTRKQLKDYFYDLSKSRYEFLNSKEMLQYHDSIAKFLLLHTMSDAWKNHIHSLNNIRESIHNRAYAQQDPLQEYKKEAFALFSQMIDKINHDFIEKLYRCIGDNIKYLEEKDKESELQKKVIESTPANAQLDNLEEGRKIKRNDPCYCNSGKKYKHCHGKLA